MPFLPHLLSSGPLTETTLFAHWGMLGKPLDRSKPRLRLDGAVSEDPTPHSLFSSDDKDRGPEPAVPLTKPAATPQAGSDVTISQACHGQPYR